MKQDTNRFLPFACAVSLAALLTGCGGGGDVGATSVLSMQATGLKYNGTMTVLVSGRLLSQGTKMTVDSGCDTPVKATTSTDESATFTCKLSKAGPIAVSILNANDQIIGSLTAEVPLPQMTVVTSLGTFVLELDPVKAPVTVANFVAYQAAGFYTSMIFHRVINDQLIQTGGYLTGPKAKPPTRDPIVLESNNGLKNQRGTVAMARIDGEPDSASAEFFVNTIDNPGFDRQNDQSPGYAVFGTVVSGLDVVDKIKVVPVTSVTVDGTDTVLDSVPVTDVKITSITQSR